MMLDCLVPTVSKYLYVPETNKAVFVEEVVVVVVVVVMVLISRSKP